MLKTVLFAFIATLRFSPVSGQFDKQSMDSIKKLSEEDHAYLLKLLHIDSLRPGANGSGNPNVPYAANYDESKANPYPVLPDPLLLKNGKKVTTPSLWWQKRRPEIVEDFDREVYGRTPQQTPKVRWEIIATATENMNGTPVITKKLIGHVDNSIDPSISVNIQLSLTTPANANGPVPVMMELAFVLPPGFKYPAGSEPKGPSWQQQLIDKGWGFAIIIPTSFQADNGAGLTTGIIGLLNKGQRRKVDDWGTLKAWAWGASKALDYFETDKSVNAKAVGIEGHSRFGKAALVTMAYDPRFAIAYVSSSGEGGAKLHRRNAGEIVENVAAPSEYHWMAGNFVKYAGPLNWNDLPVDSHELIALCAPRPVFIGVGANGDSWAEGRGMFMAEVAAAPVYHLLGKKALESTEYPTVEKCVCDGELAFRLHPAGHTPAPNWPAFIHYAEKYLQ